MTPHFGFLGPGDQYITRNGMLLGGPECEVEFVGAFGRMMVPHEVQQRARRLKKFGIDKFEYMVDWCDRRLEESYREVACLPEQTHKS